ncbi:MAG: restriction endonuclease subunit S [Flavipsychrobacter sp.]|nr:restriction endonuclease subunit S [Flavipsychrobacter sp.]
MSDLKDKININELPNDWKWTKLSLVAKCVVGIASSATHAYSKKGILLIRNQNIKEGKIEISDALYINEMYENGYKSKRLKAGNILTVRTGYPGISAVVPKELEGSQSFTTLIIRDIADNVNSYFLCYFINSDYGKKFFSSNQAGGGQQNVGAKTLENLIFPLPPLPEQQKIAEILSTVDEKIELIEAQINQTTELKKGLMQQLLTKGIGHTKFKDSPLGKIPESWEVVKLEKYCDVRDGTHDSPKYLKEGIPFITSKNLSGNNLDFSDVKYISHEDHLNFSKRSFVDDGDILFAMIGTVGNPIVVKKEFEFSIKNVALLKFKKEQLINTFALNVLRSKIVENQFQKISNGGVLKFVALGNIRNLNFPIPPTHEQQQIATILNTIDDKIVSLVAKKTQYINFKKGLMQQLLTGKLRVNLNPTNHAAKSGELQAAE